MLLETLISLTIFAIFILFFVASWNNISATQDFSWKRVQASIYAQEGVEVAYNIITNSRDWVNLTRNLDKNEIYKIKVESPPGFVIGREEIDEFTREVKIEPVYRSMVSHEIVPDGKAEEHVYDPDTLLLKCVVRWVGKGGSQELEYVTYVTRGAEQ